MDAVVFAHARQALQSEEMKPRHAIALVGWYLMVPTFCVPGNPVPCLWDPGAPLNTWTQGGCFNSAADCTDRVKHPKTSGSTAT